MVCKAGIAGALDILETRLREGDPDTVTMLHEEVSYCERNRAQIWVAYSPDSKRLAGSRLLKLCTKGGGLGDVVRVLKLLSEPFKLQGYGSVSPIGIVDADTSTAIASAVHTHGWVDCGPFVLNMLAKEQVMAQGRYFAHLALELHKLGCEDADLLVARRTRELSFNTSSSLTHLQGEMIVSMGKLVFCFKGMHVGGGFQVRGTTRGGEPRRVMLIGNSIFRYVFKRNDPRIFLHTRRFV